MSIGPRTDAVLDRFKLDHSLIPRIRVLTNRRRSSDWEKMFRSKAWGLTYEAADKLTQALLDDIMAEKRLTVAEFKVAFLIIYSASCTKFLHLFPAQIILGKHV